MKRRITKIILAVVLLAAVAAPTYMWTQAKARTQSQIDVVKEQVQTQFLQQAFVAQYGNTDVKLLGVNKTEDYLFYWQNATTQYVSVYVQGKWVELGNAPLTTTTP
jgi:uncharacterized protein YxeA